MVMGVTRERRVDWSYRHGINIKPGREATAWEWQDGGQWPDVPFVSSYLSCHIQTGASVMPGSTLEWQGGKTGRTVSQLAAPTWVRQAEEAFIL